MKTFLIVLAFFMSNYALSLNEETNLHFEGKGTWVTEDGEKGHYKVTIEGTHENGSLLMTETYSVDGSSQSYSFTILKKENDFADIMKDGEKIGNGYCFMGVQGKICHMTYTHDGHTIEKTCKMRNGKLRRVGSVKGPNGSIIKFKDKLQLVDQSEAPQD